MHTTPPLHDDAAIVAGLLDEAARTDVVTADLRERVAQILDGHQRRHRDDQDAPDTQGQTMAAVIEAVEADRAETRLHNAPSTTPAGQLAEPPREVRAALAAAINRNHLSRVHANTVLADLHLPALLGYFDVTATIPVTVRVLAIDADDAGRTAVALIADDLTGTDHVQVRLDLAGGVQVTEDHAEPVNPDDEPATGPGSQR